RAPKGVTTAGVGVQSARQLRVLRAQYKPHEQAKAQLESAKKKLSKTEQAVHDKKTLRTVHGRSWRDETLADWPDNDVRMFVGNLCPRVNDEQLHATFSKWPSF
ncbi:hypothetical protein KIPB_013805, partial [Kipferlia bialata]